MRDPGRTAADRPPAPAAAPTSRRARCGCPRRRSLPCGTARCGGSSTGGSARATPPVGRLSSGSSSMPWPRRSPAGTSPRMRARSVRSSTRSGRRCRSPPTTSASTSAERVDEMIAALLAWDASTGRSVAATELTFTLPVPGTSRPVAVSGSIDRVDRAEDGRIHVVDFKTGRTAASAAATAEHPQLGIYQLAIRLGALDGAWPTRADAGAPRRVPPRPGGARPPRRPVRLGDAEGAHPGAAGRRLDLGPRPHRRRRPARRRPGVSGAAERALQVLRVPVHVPGAVRAPAGNPWPLRAPRSPTPPVIALSRQRRPARTGPDLPSPSVEPRARPCPSRRSSSRLG